MSDILELAALCTNIIIRPTYKAGDAKVASVDAHVVIKAGDGLFQYADVHAEAMTTELAISRALKAAKAYEAGCL